VSLNKKKIVDASVTILSKHKQFVLNNLLAFVSCNLKHLVEIMSLKMGQKGKAEKKRKM